MPVQRRGSIACIISKQTLWNARNMKREKLDSPELVKVDEPRPASRRLISQLQAAVRRAQERKDNTALSPLAVFAAELDAKARGREPVEFLGSLGRRPARAVEKDDKESVD